MKKPPNFETALHALESIVQKLEQGNVPLEEALKSFEEGVRLSRHCAQSLDAAEKRIQELTKGEDGQPVLQPWEGEDA